MGTTPISSSEHVAGSSKGLEDIFPSLNTRPLDDLPSIPPEVTAPDINQPLLSFGCCIEGVLEDLHQPWRDGYNHTRMGEMYAAVCRLPSMLDQSKDQAVRTGADDVPVQDTQNKRSTYTGHSAFPRGPTVYHLTSPYGGFLASYIPLENRGYCTPCLTLADVGLSNAANRDILQETSPRSSVG